MQETFPVAPTGITAAFEFLARVVNTCGMPESVGHRLAVIVDEICSNMIRHDAALDEGDVFELELVAGPREVTLTISDGGTPFDPLAHRHESKPEIGGHGISVVKGLAKEIAYARTDGRNRLVVTVVAEE